MKRESANVPCYALVGIAGLALAGCSAGVSQQNSGQASLLPTAATRAAVQTASHQSPAVVYVAQTNGAGTSTVFGYRAHDMANRGPVCRIQSVQNVAGIGSDAAGNLYIPNGGTGEVDVFAPGCGSLVAKIQDPAGFPLGVAFHGSAVYVANENGNVAVCTLSGCGATLTDASIRQMTSAAVDSSGNVWAAYYNQDFAISLIVWQGGVMPGHVVSGYVNTPVPGGILFDDRDVLVSVATGFATVFIYHCDATQASCKNTRKIALANKSSYGALNAANTSIQITAESKDAVDVFHYPTFRHAFSYNRGLLTGFAAEGITETN